MDGWRNERGVGSRDGNVKMGGLLPQLHFRLLFEKINGVQ